MTNLQQEYIQFIQWLLDNEDMQRWLISISGFEPQDRTIEIRNTAIQLSQTNTDEHIVKMVARLVEVDVFDSVRAVLLAELNRR